MNFLITIVLNGKIEQYIYNVYTIYDLDTFMQSHSVSIQDILEIKKF